MDVPKFCTQNLQYLGRMLESHEQIASCYFLNTNLSEELVK